MSLIFIFSAEAQYSLPLHHGERVDFDLYFKWGLIMSKAGMATLSVEESSFRGQPSWRYGLLFRSAGIIEKIYSMRDTMDCHYSREPRLLYAEKRSDEDNYYQVDKLRFSYPDDDSVVVESYRSAKDRVKVDTTLTGRAPIFDMLGDTMYLRSLDWDRLNYGDERPFVIAIGRDLVNAKFRYTGQQIVEHKKAKFRTRHFYIDIYDEAFIESKAAAEVWIGDDDNHIPVKIRAKLKLGAAEVYYKESYNLKRPLECRIVMP